MLTKNVKVKKTYIAGFTILLMLFLALSIMTYHSLKKAEELQNWVLHSQKVITRLTALSNQLFLSENANLNYLLTKHEQYLQQHQFAMTQINNLQIKITTLTVDNPTQQHLITEINGLIDHYQNLTNQHIKQFKNTPQVNTLKVIESNKELLGKIEVVITQMIDNENKLLVSRQASALNENIILFSLIILSTFALGILFFLVIFLLQKLSQHQQKLEETTYLTEVIMRTVSEADTSTDAFKLIIKSIGENIGWDMGEAWLLGEDQKLISDGCWYNPKTKNLANLKKFHEISTSMPLDVKNNIPGRCFLTKEPIWLHRPEFKPDLIRSKIAEDLEIYTIFAVPIIADDQTIIVIDFLSSQDLEKNTEQINFARSCSNQLGLILKRKIAEEKLKINEERFQLIAQATKDVIWDWDLKKNEFWFSAGIQTLFGYPESEVEKKFHWWMQHIHPDDQKRIEKNIFDKLHHPEKDPNWSEEYRFRCHNGNYIEILDRGYILYDEQGKPVRMLGTIMDITDRKKLENMKSEFISMVSHELRTPLTSIRGSLGLILGGTAGTISEKANQLILIAYNNCERLIRLINDILDIEKIEAGKIEFVLKPTNIQDVIQEAVTASQGFAAKFQIKLETQNQIPCIVNVDRDRLIQVLINLISNAIKFSPPGEVVSINTEQLANSVRIKVIDHGEGIAPAFHDRIFQRFAQADSSTTRHKGGTGLGLNISKTIIERFGGTISFQTKLGKGSIFYFDLPIIKTEMSFSPKENDETQRILIIEDDEDISFLLKELLLQNGFEADIAPNGKTARELLHSRKYTAITLDLILPDVDGVSLLQEFREDPTISLLPIIIISVKADETRTNLKGQLFPIIDWINKPVDVKRLASCLRLLKLHTKGKEKPKILHIEDDMDVVNIIYVLLSSLFEVKISTTLSHAKQLIAHEHFDLALLDLALPDGDGAELIPLLTKQAIPIVVFSAHELPDPSQVTAVLTKSKTSNEELLDVIKRVIEKHHDTKRNSHG